MTAASSLQHEPGSVGRWLQYARGDLVMAEQPTSAHVPYLLTCFHAQQATETTKPPEEMPSLYTVEVIGYGGGASDAQAEDDTEKTKNEEDPDNPSVAEPQ